MAERKVSMTKEEMATKIVVGKHIILEMVEGEDNLFWKALINGRTDRLLAAVERGITPLRLDKTPTTDEEVADLIFKWTLPVRAEVALEFLPKPDGYEVIEC